MKLYTIGFTKKSAPQFFQILKAAHVARVVDVRLNNVSQLAGFAKKSDLAYFLDKIGTIQYVHVPLLAPTQDMLDSYKKRKGDWQDYEREFLELMKGRRIDTVRANELRDSDCLLCSEERPAHCHRRLVAEYLAARDNSIQIEHLS